MKKNKKRFKYKPFQHPDWRANLVKDFFKINFPPMRALKFITGHVTFKLPYDQIYQMKTTHICSVNGGIF